MSQITIESCVNHGTIIQLVGVDETGAPVIVNMDSTPFRWLVEGVGDPRGLTFERHYDDTMAESLELIGEGL